MLGLRSNLLYFLCSISPDTKSMVFVYESNENIPAVWRAKKTYRWINDTDFEETFELDEPKEGFKPYSKVRLNRKHNKVK